MNEQFSVGLPNLSHMHTYKYTYVSLYVTYKRWHYIFLYALQHVGGVSMCINVCLCLYMCMCMSVCLAWVMAMAVVIYWQQRATTWNIVMKNVSSTNNYKNICRLTQRLSATKNRQLTVTTPYICQSSDIRRHWVVVNSQYGPLYVHFLSI